MSKNAYGELNPLYPTYYDKDVELSELMRFFKFSYRASSGYAGTAVFEILDNDKTYIMAIRADPETGVEAFRELPADNEISFHCILPYDTFHNAFWGYTTARTLVMGGGCKIKDWAYRAVYNFGTSFDLTSQKWVEYYQSGGSIKTMSDQQFAADTALRIDTGPGIERINAINQTQTIGFELPKCAKDTDFMYEWHGQTAAGQLSELQPVIKDGKNKMDLFDSVYLWRNKQRDIIKMNNRKHVWLWDNSNGGPLAFLDGNKYMKQMERYRENLTFNPVVLGRNLKEKIKKGSVRIMERTVEEYYGFYSEYTRHKIGEISLSRINSSIHKFTSLLRKQTAENEVVHFSLLNSMF